MVRKGKIPIKNTFYPIPEKSKEFVQKTFLYFFVHCSLKA
jgi:hypothetical protein